MKDRQESGFTLIEILVVLVIVGMLASISFPRLVALYASVENASRRSAIKDQIEGLGYLAYATGKPIVLGSGSAANDFPLQLPTGWHVDSSKPLLFTSRGFCGGGKLRISDPDGGKEVFRLDPPHCRLRAVDGDDG